MSVRLKYDGVLLCEILPADEAMRINKKLTSANEKQGETIASLKKVKYVNFI